MSRFQAFKSSALDPAAGGARFTSCLSAANLFSSSSTELNTIRATNL